MQIVKETENHQILKILLEAQLLLQIQNSQYLLMMIAGTIGGIMIGAMPGLTSVMGVTLLLPFTYGMD